MKIVLLGHEDIASACALNMLIAGLPGHDFTALWSPPIVAGETVHAAMRDLEAKDRQLFGEFLESPVASTALRSASYLAAPNSVEGLRLLRDQAPDLIVSIRYRRILKDDAIAIPRLGVLNLHSGILPDFRGVMATFWAMLNGEAEIGSTLHRIVDAGIDTGPVIDINRRAVDYRESYLANVLGLYPQGCAMIAEVVRLLSAGRDPGAHPQQTGRGAYYSAPQADDVSAFLAKGLALITDSDVDTPLDALITKMNSLQGAAM